MAYNLVHVFHEINAEHYYDSRTNNSIIDAKLKLPQDCHSTLSREELFTSLVLELSEALDPFCYAIPTKKLKIIGTRSNLESLYFT